MKKNIKKLGKNYNGEDIKFDEYKLSQYYDEISKIILNDIVNKDLSVWQGKDLLKKIYEICKNGTLEFAEYASCGKGCSSCCQIYLDCTAVEAELIREYVIKNFNESELKSISKIIGINKNKTPNYKEILDNEKESSYDYMKKKIPCMFLKEDKSCSIYEVRPFNCRRLINFSDKSLCENGESIIVPNISVNYITGYAANQLSMNISRYKRLKTYCEQVNEEKAIYKSLCEWFEYGLNEINREV